LKISTLKAAEVKKLVKEGKWKKLDFYTICYAPSQDFKFAFSATKEVRTKVLRNRIKRLLKEAIRTSNLSIKAGHFLIIGNPQLLNMKFQDLKTQLKRDLEALIQSPSQ
jgi:ribonuclease P protein component